jgi:hypothetical protein
MLSFTPQIQNALGDAALIADGDVLYIVNRDWMLVVARPERFIDPEVLDLVRNFKTSGSRWRVNWRILCAREIDLAQNKFLPHRSRKFLPIGLDCWHDFPSLRVEELRQLIEEKYLKSVWGDLVDLSSMFSDGLARASYRVSDVEGQKFAKRPSAQTYQFRFDDKLVCVSASWWRAFEELGLTIVCPREGYLEDLIAPPLGLRSGEHFDVAGFFLPETCSGVMEDKKGRKLYTDAAIACWLREGKALQLLGDPRHYSVDTESVWEQVDVYHAKDLRTAISALRWQGWHDDDIEGFYRDNRRAAYLAKQKALHKHIDDVIERLSDDRLTSWSLKNIERDLERYCTAFDKLNQRLESDDLGRLPEAVALLTDKLEANNPSSAWRA